MTELEQLKQRVEHLEGMLNSFAKGDRFLFGKSVQFSDARNIQFGQTTGTQIGTAASQKLAFFGQTPRVQVPTASIPSTAAGIVQSLKDFGLYQP